MIKSRIIEQFFFCLCETQAKFSFHIVKDFEKKLIKEWIDSEIVGFVSLGFDKMKKIRQTNSGLVILIKILNLKCKT